MSPNHGRLLFASTHQNVHPMVPVGCLTPRLRAVQPPLRPSAFDARRGAPPADAIANQARPNPIAADRRLVPQQRSKPLKLWDTGRVIAVLNDEMVATTVTSFLARVTAV